MNDDHLRVYLDDHLAGSVAALDLIDHCLDHNPTGPLGAFLASLKEEIEGDRAVLVDLRKRVGGERSPVKEAASWLMHKATRAKVSKMGLSYTELSTLLEIEGIALGVHGKLALWTALEAARGADERFRDVDFPALQARARRQREAIEQHRLDAARKAFPARDEVER